MIAVGGVADQGRARVAVLTDEDPASRFDGQGGLPRNWRRARPCFGSASGELDERAEVGVEIADVEAALVAAQLDRVHPAALSFERANRIGELNLPARARARAFERVEDRRRQHVTRGDGQVAPRLSRRRLFDQVAELEHALAAVERFDDAVAVRVGGRDLLDRDDRGRAERLERLRHARDDVALRC